MSYSDTTPNLNLPQWDDQDEWDVEDLNTAMGIIDENMDHGIITLGLGENWSQQSSGTYGNLRAAIISPRAVLIHGVIKSNTANDTSVIATLPVGYRPTHRMFCNILRLGAPDQGMVLRIDTDGVISFYQPDFSAGSVLCITNVVFLREQT